MSNKPQLSERLEKNGGMSTLKQFLLSLLATTVSIALTFGTAAVIDRNKEQNEKHEIVMMVMYDMYNSMMSIEKADASILQSMEIQRQMAEDPTQFDELRFQIAQLMPKAEYTETTERFRPPSTKSYSYKAA